jgi:hypothetical protein
VTTPVMCMAYEVELAPPAAGSAAGKITVDVPAFAASLYVNHCPPQLLVVLSSSTLSSISEQPKVGVAVKVYVLVGVSVDVTVGFGVGVHIYGISSR